MIPRWVSRETDARDRGYNFGVALSGEVANTVDVYRRMIAAAGHGDAEQLAAGHLVGEMLSQRAPDLRDEIEGIAQGAGQRVEHLLACNARTELLSAAPLPECTAIGVSARRSSDGHTLLGQNWDWYPALRPSRVVWTVAPEGSERWLTTFTEAGLVGKIGLNSDGLGCVINILGCTADGGVGGLPVHVAVRLLLAECRTLPEALRLLMNETFTASTCFNLGAGSDAGGMTVAVEVSPGGAVPLRPHPRGHSVHTNHFVAPPPQGEDAMVTRFPDSLVRLWDAESALETSAPVDAAALQAAFRSHVGGNIAVCCHDELNPVEAEQQATLASFVMDLTERRMFVTDGQPCTAAYEEIARPDDRVKAAV